MRGFMAIAISLVLIAGASTDAGAQSVLKRIKENAKQKVTDRKAETKDRIVDASAEPVDSALAKASQPVDSVISKTSSGAAAVVSRAGGAVESALGKGNALAEQIAEGLETGRVAIPEITFHAGTSVFADDAEPALAALSDALAQAEGTFLIEGHVAPDAARDAAALRPLSAARAMAVKEWLAASGIDASRLVTLGAGATREPGEGEIADRIELVAVR